MTEVVGGPLDGLQAGETRFVAGTFRWLGRREERVTCFVAPGPRRLLYRWHQGVWLFAGDSHRVCGNCGALVRNPEGGRERAPCGLCADVPAPA